MINWEQQFTEEFILKLLGQQPQPTNEEEQNESTEQD